MRIKDKNKTITIHIVFLLEGQTSSIGKNYTDKNLIKAYQQWENEYKDQDVEFLIMYSQAIIDKPLLRPIEIETAVNADNVIT